MSNNKRIAGLPGIIAAPKVAPGGLSTGVAREREGPWQSRSDEVLQTLAVCKKCAIFFAAHFLAFFFMACGNRPEQSSPALLPAKARVTLNYAKGFRIYYYNGFREVSIVNHISGKTDTLHYLLVDSGNAPPAGMSGIPVIHTPVKQFAVQSSAHVGLLEFCGAADRITGLGSFQYIYSPVVREGIRTGKVQQIGIDNQINSELVISMHPGVLIAMTNPDAAFGQYKALIEAGIPVLPDAEWMETTPLGRAEWVKLIGALIDREDSVGRLFDTVSQRYIELAAIGRRVPVKPTVIVNMPFKGSWYLPGGDNYMTQLLRDAGATYPWANTRGSNSLALNFEAVAPVALKADYWLNVGYVDSKKDVLAKDSRYGTFHSFQTDALYNFNKRVNDIGSNDFWESGLVNPQLVLADLIRILHPGLLPADSLYYYKQLK